MLRTAVLFVLLAWGCAPRQSAHVVLLGEGAVLHATIQGLDCRYVDHRLHLGREQISVPVGFTSLRLTIDGGRARVEVDEQLLYEGVPLVEVPAAE